MGQVKNIVRYGAFVSLNGVDALLHQNDELNKAPPVHEVIRLGQTLNLKVLEVNPEEENDCGSDSTDDTRPFELIKENTPKARKSRGPWSL